jgi:hypothetical protein
VVQGAWKTIAAIVSALVMSALSRTSPPSPVDSTMAPGFHAAVVVATHIEQRDELSAAGVRDRFGNEVSDAVAEFKLDGTGSLYEVHSPQTELAALPAPIS